MEKGEGMDGNSDLYPHLPFLRALRWRWIMFPHSLKGRPCILKPRQELGFRDQSIPVQVQNSVNCLKGFSGSEDAKAAHRHGASISSSSIPKSLSRKFTCRESQFPTDDGDADCTS